MTSNIGSPLILEQSGRMRDPAGRLEVEAAVMQEMRRTFRPEFLNRVDDIIVFRPLDSGDLKHIVELQLVKLRKMLEDQKLTLVLTDEAKEFISQEGYDPAYGARPLKRAIQRLVQNPLAVRLLEGAFEEGSRIVADLPAGSNKLEFRVGNGEREEVSGSVDTSQSHV